jgi:lipopolysaccharide export system protein LptC
MNFRGSLVAIVLLSGAILTTVMLLRSRTDEAELIQTPLLGNGYFLRGAKLTGTGEDGQILYKVRAESVAQNESDGSIRMRTIEVVYEPSLEIPWRLEADAGRIPALSRIIQMSGNVVATTLGGPGANTEIRTDYLEMDPQSFIANTPRKVAILHRGGTVNATGMRAWLKEDRFELVSNVNGRFSP